MPDKDLNIRINFLEFLSFQKSNFLIIFSLENRNTKEKEEDEDNEMSSLDKDTDKIMT